MIKRLHPYFIICIVAFGLSYPFIGQAFSIDDPFTIWLGQSTLNDIYRPYNAESYWYDEPARLFDDFRNPPLVGYFCALFLLFSTVHEWSLHLYFIPVFILCGISFYMFAKGWTRHTLTATILFLSVPVIVVQAHHIMPDMLCLSLFLTGLALYRSAVKRNSVGLSLIAGFVGGMSGLCKYSGLIWLPIILFYTFYVNRESKRSFLSAVTGALFINMLWIWGSWFLYGKCHLFETLSAFDSNVMESFMKFLTIFCHIGGNAIPLVFLCKRQKFKFYVSVFGGGCIGLFALMRLYPDINHSSLILCSIFLFCGLFIFLYCLFPSNKSSFDENSIPHNMVRFLRSWLVLGFLSTLFVTPFVASRYLMLWLAPVILVLFIEKESDAFPRPDRVRIVLYSMLILGILISLSDYRFAQSHKALARTVSEHYDDQKVVFTGHWGFQYYMELSGFEALKPDTYLENGTYIVRPTLASSQPIPEKVKSRMFNIRHFSILQRFPLLIMAPKYHTSFYIYYYGPLPWTIATGFKNGIDIYYYHQSALPVWTE